MPTTRPAAILAISSKNSGSVQPGSRKPGGIGLRAPSASVSIAPGETQLTVMPCRTVSPAKVIVNPIIDPLPIPASSVWNGAPVRQAFAADVDDAAVVALHHVRQDRLAAAQRVPHVPAHRLLH